jgi:hypothetical protein
MRCEYFGDSAFYARFRTVVALRREVRAAPPVYRVCDGARWVYPDHEVGSAASFRRRCARDGGQLYEGTRQYCVAGTEVIVDRLVSDRDVRELCVKLDGRVLRPPPGAARQ